MGRSAPQTIVHIQANLIWNRPLLVESAPIPYRTSVTVPIADTFRIFTQSQMLVAEELGRTKSKTAVIKKAHHLFTPVE